MSGSLPTIAKQPAPASRQRRRNPASAPRRGNAPHRASTARPKDVTRGETGHIHEQVMRAVVEHRLPPGTKLGEAALAELFGSSRARVREALRSLALMRIVTIHANRGAFVTEPGVTEARDVFAARRLIEPPLIASLVGRLGSAQMQRVRRHVADEFTARDARDRHASIELSGAFHLLLAELAGNGVMLDIVRGLVARSSLIIALYQRAVTVECGPDEHRELADALGGRAATVARLMDHHLRHVETSLVLTESPRQPVNLHAVLGANARKRA